MRPYYEHANMWSTDDDGGEDAVLYEDDGEAIAEYLAAMDASEWPRTIEVYGWARTEPTDSDYRVLDDLLQHMDENYCVIGRGFMTEPTAAAIAAEDAFIAVIRSEYDWHAYTRVTTKTVDVDDWVMSCSPEVFADITGRVV